jgi:hypothetical protein
MGEEDISMKQENRWRKANSFSTLEIFDEADELVVARFLVYETFENERFEGCSRKAWPFKIMERYGSLLIEAISAHSRKKELENWLKEWPGVASIVEIKEEVSSPSKSSPSKSSLKRYERVFSNY